jgi:hypothetical protein
VQVCAPMSMPFSRGGRRDLCLALALYHQSIWGGFYSAMCVSRGARHEIAVLLSSVLSVVNDGAVCPQTKILFDGSTALPPSNHWNIHTHTRTHTQKKAKHSRALLGSLSLSSCMRLSCLSLAVLRCILARTSSLTVFSSQRSLRGYKCLRTHLPRWRKASGGLSLLNIFVFAGESGPSRVVHVAGESRRASRLF